jgi:hypothetical protein
MTKTTFTMALLALAIAGGSTAAFAQSSNSNHNRLYMSEPLTTGSVSDGRGGEGRQTAYGAGGSAGTHPTGANVGPNHAAMEHAN